VVVVVVVVELVVVELVVVGLIVVVVVVVVEICSVHPTNRPFEIIKIIKIDNRGISLFIKTSYRKINGSLTAVYHIVKAIIIDFIGWFN
jgi:hypothetical protein